MSKVKSFFKVLGLVVLVAVLLEVLAYGITSFRLIKEGYKFDGMVPYPTKISMFSKNYLKYERNVFFENYKGMNYKTNPILVFGDVYAGSTVLGLDESVTAKLSATAKKPVLNLAKSGWGIPHMHYILKNEPLLDEVKNVDTILFVYNDLMKTRLSSFSYFPHYDFLYLKYTLDEGILLEQVPQMLFAYNSYFVRTVENFVGSLEANSNNINTKQKLFKLMNSLFVNSKKIAKAKYPKFNKFVILRYVSNDNSLENLKLRENDLIAQAECEFWEQLQKEGFTIIDLPELTSNKTEFLSYEYMNYDYSPNKSAWDIIVPKLVKELK